MRAAKSFAKHKAYEDRPENVLNRIEGMKW